MRLLRDDWRKNYRYHGGLRALARCALGHRRLRQGRALPEPDREPLLDCTVFSVVPEMSAMWAVLFERVVRVRPARILLGDCSGGLRGESELSRTVPLLNVHHGEKLDLFFAHLVRSSVVLVTDDDIFWLDDEPLRWALGRLAEDPDVAVVSLVPKAGLSSVLRGKVERAMGSVLLVRREVWVRERLSFRIVHPPASAGVKWHFDTGEFAQVELGRRGCRVELAPEDLRRHFVFFEGISSWTLKIQKYEGRLRPVIGHVPVRQEKALAAVLVLRGLAELLASAWPEGGPHHLVSPAILSRTEGLCLELLDQERADEIRRETEASLDRLHRFAAGLRIGTLGGDVRRLLAGDRRSAA